MWFAVDEDDTEINELRTRAFYQRRAANILRANPDCRDPDHPGCAKCDDEGEANELEAA